ncbi:hypothetical protein C0993_006599 [Termitomyces sp. T159_Od127]|nr:hypothetical protein C0993_006599 [Termitomyces sp. T159_Od127]
MGSHPNDEDAHFRLSEEQIFTSIFAYVDHLFGKIKPKKLFFMAVDGVAPRAKMNQQRSRRFRSAKEAKEVREKAIKKGEKLPDEKAFDSNCITPGTPFMTRLSAQLRYFINKKITEDSDWRNVEVVLSGHEVPGEGEHKIMEYIRLSRAQPDYNPNVRHCLYGLDADLIMLGLLSHDPHFCLLREEVKFGPSSRRKGNTSLESMNFYLLHLSLMREYLDLEFRDIEPILPFDYNLERVIDDFILLAVFVGNDFLPNLPDLHIHENGLEKLFDVYKKVLPAMDGYINESGVINTQRLQLVLDEMAQWEQEIFEKEYADANWYKGKQAKHVKEMELAQKRAKLVLTAAQRDIFDQVKAFVLDNRKIPSSERTRGARLAMPNDFPARERKFIEKLAEDLHLNVRWDEYNEQDVNLVTLRFPDEFEEPEPTETNGTAAPNGNSEGEDGDWEDVEDEDEDEESRAAVDRVLKKYEKSHVMQDDEGGGFDARHDRSVKEKMDEWKRGYYRGKLEISYDNPEQMEDLIFKYVEGLQWVMHYYYSGVASWGWFYSYHYAPRISDLRGVNQMTFQFELGKPFRPFEQLMGVLPAASRDNVPSAYQDLMYDSNSPILDFYPEDFEQDLNGKKQDWEAIVKIPFIDSNRLLSAMACWPFLQEGLVVAVSDSLFKYEKLSVVHGAEPKVVSTPHAPQGLGHWKMKAERIEQIYSKRMGVITGAVDVLLHVRPLKGLKRLEDGAFVKDYEEPDKESEHAVQMCLPEVVSEDPRYLERAAPPLSEEFPDGSNIFFLGEHAYGVAAKVSTTTEKSLSVILAFFPAEKAEIDQFKAVVESRRSARYFPSFKAADILKISGRALSKITSSFMVITSDNRKTNLGLSLKFEAKALKVIDYTPICSSLSPQIAFPDIFNSLDASGDAMAQASEMFPGPDPDARVEEIKGWLKGKGVRDLEPVSLYRDHLSKDTVAEIEKLEDGFTANKATSGIKKAIVKGIPRQAVLKPGHAVYRLQNQTFALGDRVTMVQDSGSVPLSVKGVVIGLNSKSMDVVWDVPFMAGVTLGDRSFVVSTHPKAPPPPPNTKAPFNPRFGPYPAVRPPPGQSAASGFRPAPPINKHGNAPIQIMSNPNRGRGGYVNGRGSHHSTSAPAPAPSPPTANQAEDQQPGSQASGSVHTHANNVHGHRGRGFVRGGGRGFIPGFRGRGGFGHSFDRGRGVPRGGFRGRGRGVTAPLPS